MLLLGVIWVFVACSVASERGLSFVLRMFSISEECQIGIQRSMMVWEMSIVCLALSMGYTPRVTDVVHVLVYIQRNASGFAFESVDQILFLSMIVMAEIDTMLSDQHRYIRACFYVCLYGFLTSASTWAVGSPLFCLVPTNLGRWSTYKMIDYARFLVGIPQTVYAEIVRCVCCGIHLITFNGIAWNLMRIGTLLKTSRFGVAVFLWMKYVKVHYGIIIKAVEIGFFGNCSQTYEYNDDDDLEIYVENKKINSSFLRTMVAYRKDNFDKNQDENKGLSNFVCHLLDNEIEMILHAIRLNPNGFSELVFDQAIRHTNGNLSNKDMCHNHKCALLLVMFIVLERCGAHYQAFDARRRKMTFSASSGGPATNRQCVEVLSSILDLM
jgi:hypothetical protein